MRLRGRDSELGQGMVEVGGVLVVIALIIFVVFTSSLPDQIARGVKCSVEKVFRGTCTSDSNSNPYQVVCRVSTSTNAANLDVKIAFVKVTDNDTLVKMTYSDGSSSYLLTHTGQAQAEAAIGGKLEAGKFGVSAEASAAAGGALAGAQEWDFKTPQEAAAFDKQIQGHGGWNTIAHDVASGLPLGLGGLANWGLNHLGVHDDSGLPTPTQTYVKGGLVGGVKAGVEGGVGGASAALDAELKAALGARVTLTGPNKGQTQVYLQLDGKATGNLQAQLFGIAPGAQAGAGGVGQAVATVTLSPSGKPLNVTITAWAGYTANAGGKGKYSNPNAKALEDGLKKASFKVASGSGNGIQWSGSIDLTQNPGDVADLVGALGGGGNLTPLMQDFNQDGTQQVQPFALNRSEGGAGGEVDVGIGLGAEGNSTDTTQNYQPGVVKPPGMDWGPMVCTK